VEADQCYPSYQDLETREKPENITAAGTIPIIRKAFSMSVVRATR